MIEKPELAEVLRAGRIDPNAGNLADLRRSLREAHRYYDFRKSVRLDKRQSVALALLIERGEMAPLLDTTLPAHDLARLLSAVPVNDNDVNGRVESPITALLADLCEIYFRLKRTRRIGCGGPEYRFTQAAVKFLDVTEPIPTPDSLRKLLIFALERRQTRTRT